MALTISALYPQHVGGSLKVVRVSATFTLASGVQKNLTLKIGTAPLVTPGPSEPTITGAWMRNPTLIGCTDATHMCATRVAPLPLVSVDHPDLPAQWKTFLTTEFDVTTGVWPSWGRPRSQVLADTVPGTFGGTANYNFLSALYYRYMTSGDLDKLADAHHLAQYAGGWPIDMRSATFCAPGRSSDGNGQDPGTGTASKVVLYAEAYQGHAVGDIFPINYEAYTGLSFQPLADGEVFSGIYIDCFMCYCLSGWNQALGTVLPYMTKQFGNGFPTTPADAYIYGGRQDWRQWRQADLFYGLLTMPMALKYQDVYNATPLLPSPRTHLATYQSWYQISYFDSFDTWSKRFEPTGQPNSFLYGKWCAAPSWPGAFGSVVGAVPNFQLQIVFADVMIAYCNFVQDARVPQAMVDLATLCLNQTTGPHEMLSFQPGQFAYKIPYMMSNSTAGASEYWANTMLLPLYVYAWRVTGNTAFRDIADAHASHTKNAIGGGGPGGSSGFKEMGEVWNLAFHAAAWRAGETWGLPASEIVQAIGQCSETDLALVMTPLGGNVANFIFNIAKGRVAEFYNRVDTDDPANSALVIVVLATAGLETDAVLIDKDDLAAVVSGTTNEVTNTGYARKVLTQADLAAFAPDDTNDRVDLDFADQTWTTVAVGDGWSKVLICYDPDTTGGTDSSIIPLCAYDFVVTPNGSNITAQLDPAGFYRVS
ncbi:MAG: hypothetical protein ACREWG_06625 [Gammaproteobacteria bacterium]